MTLHDLPRGTGEAPSPPPGIPSADRYRVPYGFSCVRPSGTKDWLILYTGSGRGIAEHREQLFPCGSGDVILYPPLAPQHYRTAPGHSWELFWCHFHPKPAWMPWLIRPKDPLPFLRLRLENRRLHERVLAAFRRLLLDSRDADNPARDDLALNALEEVLLLTVRQTAETARSPDSRVQDVIAHLTRHYGTGMQVDDLARMVCLSPSRLAHLFKEQTGESVVRYLTKLRLKQAERHLRRTTRSINDIAYEVGFQTPDYFARKFKEYYGISPARYRQKHADSRARD